MDRGAWRATVHGSQAQLSDSHFDFLSILKTEDANWSKSLMGF